MRIGLAAIVVSAAATYLWRPGTEPIVDAHRKTRQLVLHFTLSRSDDPVIVLGDSIVEASTLPRSLCGHPIVNAGLSGASTASDLGNWLSGALGDRRAALIVVSLGTNDALVPAPQSKQAFRNVYSTLLGQLSLLTPRLVVLAIPPIEAQGRVTAETRSEVMKIINDYNSVLPELAETKNAAFVALPAMSAPHTIDGVHLNAAGYRTWDEAVLEGASAVCNSN